MTYKNLPISCINCRKQTTTSGLGNHHNRIHGHDEELKKRALFSNLIAGEKAKIKASNKSMDECRLYYQSPRHCELCNNEIDFFRRNNKTCSASCSASISNSFKGPKALDIKNKISLSVSEYMKNNPQNTNNKKYCAVCFHKCTQCNNIILSHSTKPGRQTCSRECQINASVGHRTYINGRRKNIYYQHINGSTILLESSWELEIAKFLDEYKIDWIRPEYIKWVDSSGKIRNYYPDFYLPKYNLYLDPKNPYAMKQDVEKMKYISSKVKILYGDKSELMSDLLQIHSVSTASLELAYSCFQNKSTSTCHHVLTE